MGGRVVLKLNFKMFQIKLLSMYNIMFMETIQNNFEFSVYSLLSMVPQGYRSDSKIKGFRPLTCYSPVRNPLLHN